MKRPVTPGATRRVLADIDAVLRSRTAEAAERVLATASPGMQLDAVDVSAAVTIPLQRDLGVRPPTTQICDPAWRCDDAIVERVHATPGMVPEAYWWALPGGLDGQRLRYAPHIVSPHIFGEADQ